MEVKFVSTSSTRLSELPILNGQLICLTDKNASFYDMGGSRRAITSVRIVSALPSTADVQEGILYGLVDSQGAVDASIWDASASTYRTLSGGQVATASSLGIVQPDGTTITINSNGVISCSSLPSSAVTYDNTTSGLAATNAQGAIDEVKVISSGAATLANSAQTTANAATSLAQEALTVAQGTTYSIADLIQRVEQLENLADVALITALPSTSA